MSTLNNVELTLETIHEVLRAQTIAVRDDAKLAAETLKEGNPEKMANVKQVLASRLKKYEDLTGLRIGGQAGYEVMAERKAGV